MRKDCKGWVFLEGRAIFLFHLYFPADCVPGPISFIWKISFHEEKVPWEITDPYHLGDRSHLCVTLDPYSKFTTGSVGSYLMCEGDGTLVYVVLLTGQPYPGRVPYLYAYQV